MKKTGIILALGMSLSVVAQQGGMWIPSELKGENEKEIKSLGGHLSAKDIYNPKKPSLKDAIVHFNGGCTAEVISKKGLLLTNHHCGYGAIQSHSTVENDYLKDGFWAYKIEEELPNPEMQVSFIKRIDDVTKQVLKGVSDEMSAKEQQELISQNIEKVSEKVKKKTWQDVQVKSFYKGNKYYLFVKEVFKDVRLVGAPSSSIGKYGSDTDNWMWPRHTGDFSMFRIYADKNNKPATYSKDNVPYKPVHSLPVSVDGVEEDDFTMVFGFPGRTNEYLPSVAVKQIVEVLNPVKIDIRNQALKIADKYMRKDPAVKLKYASKYASTANYWKKWIGESQGLKKTEAIKVKQDLEAYFLTKNPKSTLLKDFEKQYKDVEQVALARDIWIETVYRNVELIKAIFNAETLEAVAKKDAKIFNEKRNGLLDYYKGFYKNYEKSLDKEVFQVLVKNYQEKMPQKYLSSVLIGADVDALTISIYEKSAFTSLEKVTELLSGDAESVIKKLKADEAYNLGAGLTEMFYAKINPDYHTINREIQLTQKKYMKGLMKTFPNKKFFPDANSTLRIAYGKVKGYAPKDAVYYVHETTLDGVVEKYVPNDYEFDVEQKVLDLYKAKDYGIYANKKGKLPVNFIGTNHTTGGNSGSPVLDKNGNLIGLNFDRVWEGTMSDIYYDPAICRNIMVDTRYILWVVDKLAKAQRLIDEMEIVHSKK